ncbi:MAG: HD domain-containing protein [Pseudomonadales bacterium]|nr:HD domain-containing protein [Pseudomonadales bacterium]
MTEPADKNSQDTEAYVKHLSQVNEVKQVIATEDICNTQGAIIVKAGSPISEKMTQRIIKFKLVKPIESSVKIDNDIDGVTLYKHIQKVISKSDPILKIHRDLELDTKLKRLCKHYQSYTILRQKMTVLSLQMKRAYSQSLLSAWVATLIGSELNLSPENMEVVFLAAITHDIGMLHIDEAILNKKGALTPEEWRQIKAHPIITQQILDAIQYMPKETGIAVLEHHERCDGTGYPIGKFAREISLAGNIIALSDSSVAILEQLRKNGRNLRDLIPFLQMNQYAHSYRVYEAFILALRKAELSQQGLIKKEDIPRYIDQLLADISRLSAGLETVEQCLKPIGFTHHNRKVHAMQTVLINIAIAVRGAGILDENYIDFLKGVKLKESPETLREIEDVALMLNEVDFHLRRLERMIQEYVELEESSSGPIYKALQEGLENIKAQKPVDG